MERRSEQSSELRSENRFAALAETDQIQDPQTNTLSQLDPVMVTPIGSGWRGRVVRLPKSEDYRMLKSNPVDCLSRPAERRIRELSNSPEESKFARRSRNVEIPPTVIQQQILRKKHRYIYRTVPNGNVENNCTLYVDTRVAHPHQIEKLFQDTIAKVKGVPEVFGDDFECTVQVNLIRKHTGEYLGYAFVDLTSPKLYYALIGCNVDGTERGTDPPLITLGEYEYDQQQRDHIQTEDTHGTVSVSPAFITPGVPVERDDCRLYVSEVPADDPDFLYALFARYARFNSPNEDAVTFFPMINVRKEVESDKYYGTVEYSNPYDAAFALTMLRKVRARYKGTDVSMPVRYAYKVKRTKS